MSECIDVSNALIYIHKWWLMTDKVHKKCQGNKKTCNVKQRFDVRRTKPLGTPNTFRKQVAVHPNISMKSLLVQEGYHIPKSERDETCVLCACVTWQWLIRCRFEIYFVVISRVRVWLCFPVFPQWGRTPQLPKHGLSRFGVLFNRTTPQLCKLSFVTAVLSWISAHAMKPYPWQGSCWGSSYEIVDELHDVCKSWEGNKTKPQK